MANLRVLALEQRSLHAVSMPRPGPSSSSAPRAYTTSPPPPPARAASTSANAFPSSSSSSGSFGTPMSRGRQLLSPLRRAPRNDPFGLLSSKEVQSRDAGALAAPAGASTSLSAGKRNPPLEALQTLLAEARATTEYAHNRREVIQSRHIWRAYLRVQEHADITPETWRAIIKSVVPVAAAAVEYRPKAWRKRTMTEYFEQGFDGRLDRVLRDKTSVGQPPTEDDYLFILDQFSTAGSIKRVEEVFETMVARGIAPSERAYMFRLRAISVWLQRYTSRQARSLIAKGLLMSWADAVTHLPGLVATIMVQVQEGQFPSVIPDSLVDEACLIYARLGDWDKFNSLARWGYGVDLDVPDAIPQEYLDRVQDDDVSLSRGLRKAGLNALLTLCMAAGQPWRALSSLEIFAYDTATPEHLHPALSRRRPADVAEPEDDARFLRFAPPLPPSSAISMMNLRPVSVTPPEDYTPSDAVNPSAASSSSSSPTAAAEGSNSGVPPPAGVMYEVPEPSLRFHRPSIELDTSTFWILLGGIRNLGPSAGPAAPLVALYRHVLTRALAEAYDERQRLSGALLHVLSHPADAPEARLRELQTLDGARLRVRPYWFSAIVGLVEREPDARTRFEVLGWVEDELRHWRLATEMDLWIVQKTVDVLVADRKAAVEQMTTPEGHPFFEKQAETLVAATDFARINIQSELTELYWLRNSAGDVFRKLAEARVRAAWADLRQMHALIADGHAPSEQLADGTTIGDRVGQYTALLTERLGWELEPTRTASEVGDVVPVAARFAAFEHVLSKGAFTVKQLKANNIFLQFPTAEAPNLLELAVPSYSPPTHPSLAAEPEP